MSRIRNNEELPHFFHILSYSWLSFTWGPRGENLIECMIGMGIYKALNVITIVILERPGNASVSHIIWFPVQAWVLKEKSL